jgi:hypothetical protein
VADNLVSIENLPIVVVTGLPRAGTSMIMQMLIAGGLPVFSDGIRQADVSNPKGYWEDERVKRLKEDSSWIGEACGKAIKIVVPLIPFLPKGPRYLVISIERDIDHILASQTEMLLRSGKTLDDTPERRERLKFLFKDSVVKAKRHLETLGDARLLEIQRHLVLEKPWEAALALDSFIAGNLNIERMASAVDFSLERTGKRDNRLI